MPGADLYKWKAGRPRLVPAQHAVGVTANEPEKAGRLSARPSGPGWRLLEGDAWHVAVVQELDQLQPEEVGGGRDA